jgi:hypothetical protein
MNLSTKQRNQFMHTYSKLILPILTLHVAASLLCADPMGTAFNYQGYLTDKNGNAITDQYDIKFDLYDVATGGSPRVSVTNAPVAVNKGLFTTTIDFGGIFNGNAYWLQIGVRKDGNQNPYDMQSPRLQIRPVPYALFASNAATAATATTANGVSDNSVTATKIAAGQVVKSLNGLKDNVSLLEGANITLTPNVNNNTLTIASSGGASGWSLTGNAGTTPGVNFLGTTDFKPLELHVNGSRALRLEPGPLWRTDVSVNTIGGHNVNQVSSGIIGATIAGGGVGDLMGDVPNEVSADFGTIGGGAGNSVSGPYGTIPGGGNNAVSGAGSFAAGGNAHAIHDGSFVWGDGTRAAISTGPHRFDVLATGGAGFYTGGASPAATLRVQQFVRDEEGIGVGVFVGDLNPVGNAAFESNLSSRRTHAWFAENGVPMFSVSGGGGGYFAGDLSVCTLTIRGGCDLAEPFQMSEQEIPKGSVVIIDAEHPGKLKLSTQPYDTRVAGVVSGAGGVQPGIQMSQKGTLEGTENVALTGRVYVLTDASQGAITPGDLLTTSATPGHAMKVTDHTRAQGAILGKTMSSLPEGKGLVLVLVTLQ